MTGYPSSKAVITSGCSSPNEPTHLPFDDDGRPASLDVHAGLERLQVELDREVAHDALNDRFHLGETGLGMNCHDRQVFPPFRLDDDVADLEDPLRQVPVLALAQHGQQ